MRPINLQSFAAAARVLAPVLILGLAASGCERAKPERAAVVAREGGFDPASADPFRPCTLLAIEDATQITGQPFFKVMSNNVVDGASTACSYAVGVGGLQGVVQVELFHGDKTTPAEVMFKNACKADDGASAVQKGETGAFCVQKKGERVFLVKDVVLAASVMGRWGEVDAPRSEALGARVAPRLKTALEAL